MSIGVGTGSDDEHSRAQPAIGRSDRDGSAITHVLFDCFGTLLDYDPSIHPSGPSAPHRFALSAGSRIAEHEAEALWSRAWEETEREAIRTGRECSMRDIAERYGELLGVRAPSAAALDLLVTEYLASWSAGIRLARDVRATLDVLSRRYVLSVVSNTHHPGLVEALLARFDIEHAFDRVFTSIGIGWRKPRPELFAHVLEAQGILPAQAAFVGDTWDADVLGPERAGIRAYYVGQEAPGRRSIAFADLPEAIGASGADPGITPSRR